MEIEMCLYVCTQLTMTCPVGLPSSVPKVKWYWGDLQYKFCHENDKNPKWSIWLF